MFKASGIQVAVAMALLMSMSAPAFAAADSCGQSKGECDRGKGSDISRPDFSSLQGDSQQPEGEEPEQPEARTR
jgi:hypothetical protein